MMFCAVSSWPRLSEPRRSYGSAFDTFSSHFSHVAPFCPLSTGFSLHLMRYMIDNWNIIAHYHFPPFWIFLFLSTHSIHSEWIWEPFSLSRNFFSSFAVLIPHTRVLEEENLNYLIVRHFFVFFLQFFVPIGLLAPFSVITTSIFSSCKRQLSDWNLYSAICNTRRKKLQLNLSIFFALIFGCYSWIRTLALNHASRVKEKVRKWQES